MQEQTTANNEFLRKVKARMNKKIFKSTSSLVNSEGESAAREYLQQFFNRSVDEIFSK